MTFLNTAFLAALTLGLLPILIHLLNRQRFKRVDFPTLRFLRELQRQKMRQVRIRQIILLALRTLAVLCLVLALLRPVVKSSPGLLPGVDARTTAVLIMDRSASMSTETPTGTRYRNAQTLAQEILALLDEGDEAQIIWADNRPVPFPESPTSVISLLRETIVESAPTNQGGSLPAAVKLARQVLGRSRNLHKEVYILSDFSGSGWPDGAFTDLSDDNEPLLPSDVRVFILPAENTEPQNVGITEASVISRLVTPGRPVEAAFTVYNSGSARQNQRIISIYVGGRRLAQTRTDLAPGEHKQIRMKFTPEEPGNQTGYVRIEEADDFSADDLRYFVLRVPSQLKVAVVGNKGPAADLTALALNPTGDPGAFINVTRLETQDLEGVDLSQFDALMLIDASGFSIAFENRLRSFVESGKGALIIPGSTADLREYQTVLEPLGLPAPGELEQHEETPWHWQTVDFEHPLFEGLFEQAPENVSPDIFKYLRVSPSSSAVDVITLSSGQPFMLEAKAGQGRSLFMTGSPEPEWSTLYRSGIFPPMLVSTAAYLSGIGSSGTGYQVVAGDPWELNLSGAPTAERFELRGPTQIISPIVESTSTGFILNFPALEETGAYQLMKGSRMFAAAVVNVPGKESDILPIKPERFRNIIGGRFTTADKPVAVKSAVLEGRYGRELWKLCLYMALLFLGLEMLIGRVGKREAVVAG